MSDWLYLRVGCPVEGCKYNTPTYWIHSDCPKRSNQSLLQINSDGELRCSKCMRRKSLINWRFNCNSGNHGMKEALNLNRLLEILAIMAQLTNDQRFIAKLCLALSEMFKGRQ